jgi:hypothetical protein
MEGTKVWRQRYAGWEKGLHNGEDIAQSLAKQRFQLFNPGESDVTTARTFKHEPLQPVQRSTGLRAE